MSHPSRTLVHGTKEYLEVAYTADADLTTQPVAISFDRATWTSAEWVGAVAPTRTCRILLDTAPMAKKHYTVFVRLTDNPEVPIVDAGTLLIV